MNALAGFLYFILAAAAYLCPLIVAICRRPQANVGQVAVINIFLGWTFVGWIIALTMSLRDRPQPAVTAVTVNVGDGSRDGAA